MISKNRSCFIFACILGMLLFSFSLNALAEPASGEGCVQSGMADVDCNVEAGQDQYVEDEKREQPHTDIAEEGAISVRPVFSDRGTQEEQEEIDVDELIRDMMEDFPEMTAAISTLYEVELSLREERESDDNDSGEDEESQQFAQQLQQLMGILQALTGQHPSGQNCGQGSQEGQGAFLSFVMSTMASQMATSGDLTSPESMGFAQQMCDALGNGSFTGFNIIDLTGNLTGAGGNFDNSTNAGRIVNCAIRSVGMSVRNIPGTNDGRLGCAAAVSMILQRAGYGSITTGTGELYRRLSSDRRCFVMYSISGGTQVQPGDVLLTPQATQHGHTGIYVGQQSGGPPIVENSTAARRIVRRRGLSGWQTIIRRNPSQSAIFRPTNAPGCFRGPGC